MIHRITFLPAELVQPLVVESDRLSDVVIKLLFELGNLFTDIEDECSLLQTIGELSAKYAKADADCVTSCYASFPGDPDGFTITLEYLPN